MGAVKADPYDNKRNETMYFYTDNDTNCSSLWASRRMPSPSRKGSFLR